MIPKPLIEVAESARAVVSAFQKLREARAAEASDRVLADRRKALNATLEKLEKSVVAFERKLAEAKQAIQLKKAGKPFDWAGLFNVAGKVIDLTRKAREGKLERADVRDIIDAEIIGEPEKR
jgi:soluble lytic murein transglycosylase-like protein